MVNDHSAESLLTCKKKKYLQLPLTRPTMKCARIDSPHEALSDIKGLFTL